MKNVILFSLLIATSAAIAQAPEILWQHRLGGSSSNLSYKSVAALDGGVLLGGRSNSNISGNKSENSKGDHDYWLIKCNSNGTVQWDKTIGAASPTGNEEDWFYDLIKTNDDGFLICGYSDSPASGDKFEEPLENSADFWVVKINSTGTIEWENVIGGSNQEEATTMALTIDNGFIVGGDSTSPISYDKSGNCRGLQDYWLVKLDNSGNVLWDKTYGGSGNDLLSSIVPLGDGGYLLAGNSNSNISGDKIENSRGFKDYWLIRTDSEGNELWQKTIGGSGFDHLSKAFQTADGGFFLAGYSDSPVSADKTVPNKGGNDYWIVKTDLNGIIEWQQSYGGSDYDSLLSAQQCADLGYILAGSSASGISGDKTQETNGENDAWVLKLDNNGAILWQKTIGGIWTDGFNSVSQSADGSYYLSGVTDSPLSGDINETPIGTYDYWVVKLEADQLSVADAGFMSAITVYPNPVTETLYFKNDGISEIRSISIYTVLGQLVVSARFADAIPSIDVSELKTGTYFLKINSDSGTTNTKFVKN